MASFFQKVFSRNLYIYLFFFCATLLVYVPALQGSFFFDDNIFIENNISVRTLDIPEIYTTSPTAGSGISGDNFYRPNAQLIYAVIAKIFGLSPSLFHLVPIVLHSINGFLLFLLFTYLGLRRRYAFLGALIFLLHPIQTQAVSYISGLSEPLMALTLLGSLVLFVRGLTHGLSWKHIVSIFLLAIIGFFSKENAVILAGLMFVCGLYLYNQKKVLEGKKALWVWGGVVALSILYLSLRFTVFNFTSELTGGFGISTFSNIYTESLYLRIVTFISILWQYASLILVPIGLHYETPYIASQSLLSFAGVFGFLVLFGGLFLVLLSLSKGRGIFFFAYCWFFVSILPVSGIIPTNAMYLEHWLYVPIIGIVFFVMYFLQENSQSRLLGYVLVIILCVYAVIAFDRNRDWADPLRFYQNELQYTQNSARIYANVGLELANRGDCTSAIPYYKQAILVSDAYPQTHHNLGRCLEDSGYIDEAILEYKKALEIDPNFIYSLSRLELLEKK